jgi:hypothetical protein
MVVLTLLKINLILLLLFTYLYLHIFEQVKNFIFYMALKQNKLGGAKSSHTGKVTPILL